MRGDSNEPASDTRRDVDELKTVFPEQRADHVCERTFSYSKLLSLEGIESAMGIPADPYKAERVSPVPEEGHWLFETSTETYLGRAQKRPLHLGMQVLFPFDCQR